MTSTNQRLLRFSVVPLLVAVATASFSQDVPPVLDLRSDPPQTIALDPDRVVEINPETGDVIIFPANPLEACQGGGGGCDDTQVQIVEFNAQPTPVNGVISVFNGTTIDLSWSTRGAWECRGGPGLTSLGWSTTEYTLPTQQLPTSPYRLVVNNLAAGNYTLELQCRNGSVPANLALTIEVLPVSTGDCSARTPPSGLNRDVTILRDDPSTTRTWTELFGAEFPDGTGIVQIHRIGNDQYAAVEFVTPEFLGGEDGRLKFAEVTTVQKLANPMLVSISECPGDFGPAVPTNCRKYRDLTLFNSFPWSEPATAESFDCVLQPSTRYYLNLVPAGTSRSDPLPASQNVDWLCSGDPNQSACDFGMRKE